jgi:DNA invertase Pin-like site-specific DNA recombinase
MSKQAVLYARSATESAAIARQLATCRAWIEAHGYSVAGMFADVASGLASDLPQFNAALDAAERCQGVLVTTNASRLGRAQGLYAARLAECERRGVAVQFCEP